MIKLFIKERLTCLFLESYSRWGEIDVNKINKNFVLFFNSTNLIKQASLASSYRQDRTNKNFGLKPYSLAYMKVS